MAPQFSKAYHELGRRRRNKVKQKINELLVPLKEYCRSSYKKFVNKVVISSRQAKDDKALILFDDDDDESGELAEDEKVTMSLMGKDEANLADKQYERLRSRCRLHKQLASLHQVKKKRAQLNQKITIHSNQYGFYIDPAQKLAHILSNFFFDKIDDIASDHTVLRVKFACDSTLLTKSRVQILNVTFTILNDSQLAKTCVGNYLIGKHTFN